MIIKTHFNDSEFLVNLAVGDPSVFKEVYNKFNKKIYTVVLKMLKSKVLSEEVTQEVFLKLWHHKQVFSDFDHLEAWLRTITRNLSLNTLRKTILEKKLSEQAYMQFIESDNVTEEAILLHDVQKQLDVTIEKLPAQQREVYILCQQDGLKYEEVADKLNISVNTVKTHMKRALASVRASIKSGIDLAALMILLKLF